MKPASLVPKLAAALAVLGAPMAQAQVSQKISQMPNASALTGSEYLAGVQAGANVKVTPAQIATYVNPQAPLVPGWVSGNWYAPPFTLAAAGSALTAGTMVCTMQINPLPMTVQAFGGRIDTAGTSNIQVADYANLNGYPNGAPLGYTGNIADTATGTFSAAPAGGAFTLPAGPYWACVNANDSTVALEAAGSNISSASAWAGSSNINEVSTNTSGLTYRLTLTETFGTWPAVSSSSGWIQNTAGTASAIVLHQSN